MMKAKNKERVVIVGGGFGGVKAAMELSNKRGFKITLISNTTNFEYHGALYRTATGNSPMEVVIPLREIFKRATNVEVVLDTIERINPEANTIRNTDGHIYEYDTLILALGSEINYFGLEGMEDKTYCMNTVGHTIALRHELISRFKSGKSATVAVIGGGPSGVELAGELANFAQKVTDKYHKPFVKPNVVLIEGADRLLPIFDPVLSAKVYKRLKASGVDIRLSTRVNSCEVGKVCLNTGDLDADVIVWTAGTRLPDFYQHNDVFEVERGRIKVDEYLRARNHKNIFVIGDNAATQYSGMAQTALYDAKYVARNLSAVKSKRKAAKYRPKKPVYVVPVGKNWAVLDSPKHQLSGYRAWLIRRRADLAILKNFEPYKKALKQWRKGNQLANF
jgi:NADH dehydrogenase